jgi:hypothetical protein
MFFVIILGLPGLVQGQALMNTQWAYNFDGYTPWSWFYFGTTTASWSAGSPFSPWATITYAGDTIALTTMDTDVFNCTFGDVGIYTYSIDSDTLRFTMVSDTCWFQPTVLGNGYGVPSSVGLSEYAPGNGMALYPNPTDGHVRISWPETGEGTLELYDATGRMVLHRNLAPGARSMLLELSSLSPGTYACLVRNADARHWARIVRE